MTARLPLIYGLPSVLDQLMDQEDRAPFFASEENSREYPPIQLFEDETALHLRAAIPGVSLDSVDIVFENNILVLCGAVPAPEGRHIRRERPTGRFRREVRLPCAVVPSSISASMRNGLLFVIMDKDPRARKRAIPVACFRGENP